MDLSNENVIHIKKDGIEYLQFKKLLEYSNMINHAYSLGIDKNYRTAKPNKQELSEEEYNKAINNYKMLCKAIDTDYIKIVKPNQNHTDKISIVNNKINLYKPDFNEKDYDNIDGLITDKNNIILATTNADCILLLFYDPVKNVIANVHSGWKGTMQRISTKTVEKMKEKYNCNPRDIICCICPSIRKCHFEVDKDVKDLFFNEFNNLKEIDEIIEKNDKNKWNIDTVLINKTILIEAGLREENIIDSKICSVCNCNLIHSYRVEKEGYGLETALIELK